MFFLLLLLSPSPKRRHVSSASVIPTLSASLFLFPSCHPLLSPPPQNMRCEPKSNWMSSGAKHIFQSACLDTAHIVMLIVICEALKERHDSKVDFETRFLISNCFVKEDGCSKKIEHFSGFDSNAQFYSLLFFLSFLLISSFFHASPWPYTIFQRGFDLVMGEQPSDRIFR